MLHTTKWLFGFLALLTIVATQSLIAEVSPSLEERKRGLFLGLVFGDAHGVRTEAMQSEDIQKIFGRYLSIRDPLPLHRILEALGPKHFIRTRKPGITSDDTQQAIALMLIFMNHRQWGDEGLKAWAQILVDGQSLGAWRGTGHMFRASVEKLANGTAYRESGAFSAGIGGAMRVAVVSAFGVPWSEDSKVARAIVSSTLVTHADVRAAAMSYAVYLVATHLLKNEPVSRIRQILPAMVRVLMEERLLQHYPDWRINTQDRYAFSTALGQVLARLKPNTRLEEVSQFVLEAGEPFVEAQFKRQVHPNNPFVALGGVHALALALMDKANPLETIQYISNLGDDTDTVAAIAGALLGARFGSQWIPVQDLIEAKRWRRYANAIAVPGSPPPESVTQFLAREAARTREEQAFQLQLSHLNCESLLTFAKKSP